jgi:hypothetical protein
MGRTKFVVATLFLGLVLLIVISFAAFIQSKPSTNPIPRPTAHIPSSTAAPGVTPFSVSGTGVSTATPAVNTLYLPLTSSLDGKQESPTK